MVQTYVPTHRAMRLIGNSSPSQDRTEAFQNVPWDANSKVRADGLRHKMEDFSFLVSLVIVKEILAYLSAITVALQGNFFLNDFDISFMVWVEIFLYSFSKMFLDSCHLVKKS